MNGLTEEQVKTLVLDIEKIRKQAQRDAELCDQKNQHMMFCTQVGITSAYRDTLNKLRALGIDVDAIIEEAK